MGACLFQRRQRTAIPAIMSSIGKAVTNRLITSKLEVERKFAPTPALKKLASEPLTSSPFRLPSTSNFPRAVLTRLSRKRITDKYFDRKGQLEDHGIWVRWRKEQTTKHDGTDAQPSEGVWEAKVKQGGDFVNSKFIELHGRDAIEDLMKEVGACDSVFDLKYEMGFMADRISWTVSPLNDQPLMSDDAAMTVVLDTIIASLEGPNGGHPKNFRHQVGELELEKTITTEPSDHDDESDLSIKHHSTRAMESDKMSMQLADFMKAHPELFVGRDAPLGKITAYVEHRREKAERAWKANEGGRIATMSEIKYEREFNGKD